MYDKKEIERAAIREAEAIDSMRAIHRFPRCPGRHKIRVSGGGFTRRETEDQRWQRLMLRELSEREHRETIQRASKLL